MEHCESGSQPTLVGRIFSSLIASPLNQVNELSRGSRRVLLVGCGPSARVAVGIGELSVGVDIFRPYLEKARSEGVLGNLVRADAIKLPFRSFTFDCVIALDVIEHLPKRKGHGLIGEMVRVSKRRVVIFTPNGFLPQASYDRNPHQEHFSGWTTHDLEGLGFTVLGANGLRIAGKWFSRATSEEIGDDRFGLSSARRLVTAALGALPGCAHHLIGVLVIHNAEGELATRSGAVASRAIGASFRGQASGPQQKPHTGRGNDEPYVDDNG